MSTGEDDEKTPAQASTTAPLDDLFGDDGAMTEEDPFAQMGTEEVEGEKNQSEEAGRTSTGVEAPGVNNKAKQESQLDAFHHLGDGRDHQHERTNGSDTFESIEMTAPEHDMTEIDPSATLEAAKRTTAPGSVPASPLPDATPEVATTTLSSSSRGGPLALHPRSPDDGANDPFTSLERTQKKPEYDSEAAKDSSASPIRLADTLGHDPFSGIGPGDEDDFPIGQDGQDVSHGQDDGEKDYSALLAEFAGLEDEAPAPVDTQQSADSPALAQQAGDLFGEEAGSTDFDDFLPSTEPEFLPTASSSTTPPPDLSIENSFQHSETYGYRDGAGGDVSMQTDGSNWLADTTMDDQAFDIQAESGLDSAQQPSSAPTDESDSPLAFEVPYGWYDGDTFHYYTEEEREQVRLTMLNQAGWPADHSAGLAQDSGLEGAASPALQPAFSENAARRTPNPDQYVDPYAPSSSRPTATSSTFNSGSHYSPASAASDPYAPSTSKTMSSPYDPPTSTGRASATFASPMQLADPYAPAPAAWDPYPDPPSSTQSYRSQPKPSPLASSTPRTASSARPTPPQRVASTAYDPPFLRTQKSFARPVSAAPITSANFGLPETPALPVAPTAPSAPPTGPPRRSMTPNIAPPPVVESRRTESVEGPNDSSPSAAAPADMPNAAPPKGLGRPSSSQPPRQPQRAPSYNSFDPPLRPQTHSRPPSRAASKVSPLPTPSNPSLLPPTESASAVPDRPGSRGSAGRAPPAFAQPPPPSGPPRRATPSFQPPPRPSSSASNVAPPLRPPSVSQAPAWFPPADQGEQETLASPLQVSNYAIPQLHSGQEEPDEEDGPESWGPDELEDDTVPSAAPNRLPPTREFEPETSSDAALTSHQTPKNEQPGQPQPTRPPPVQTKASGYDAYAPATSRSQAKSPRESYHPYRRTSTTSPLKARKETPDPYGPGVSSTQFQQPAHDQTSSAYDPYTPSTVTPQDPQPPSSLGLSSVEHRDQSSVNPYGAPVQRSTGYMYETESKRGDQYAPSHNQTPYDPYGADVNQYAPNAETHLRVASPANPSDFGTSPSPANYFSSLNNGPADHTYTPQQVLEQKPLSEDPLGRSTLAARNKPLAVFGFGGVLLTSFPGVANADNEVLGHARTASYGYASGRGQIWIRPVSEVVSESALKSSETSFPGPLVLDPTTGKSAANDKKKKDAVLGYLNNRADEIEKGLPYLKTSANVTRREQEGKLALIRILIAMVLSDGKLSGSPEVEEAVRAALRNPSSSSPATTFSPTSVSGLPPTNGFTTSLYQSGNHNPLPASATPAQLAQLSSMLAAGDKRDAALYAASQGLWAHALLASSGVDQDFWREIVTRFTAAELQSGVAGAAALRTSYTIFAGLGPSAIDDMVTAAHITDDPSTDQWREVISSLLFNGKPADMGYFEELGSRLTSAGLVNAGHVCSLLSPLSPFSDVTPAALERPITMSQNARDEDVIIFAEIAEFARSLIGVPKGQELPFPGLPQLLPYKLSRAWWAAELGEKELAQRYCTAVESASKVGKSGPSLLPRSLLNSLEDLQERLTGEPSTKPANLFGARKQGSKPGVNKLGSWIEGRLTKFIAGEEEDEGHIKAAPPAKAKGQDPASAPVGPFSHFSTISPGPSNPVTRRTSTADVRSGQLGVDVDSRRTSPSIGHHQGSSSSASSTYGGEQYAPGGGGYGGYQPYVPDAQGEDADEDTPHALEPAAGDDDVELLNPMAGLSLGAATHSQNDYAPTSRREEPEDDEDDLGFGNAALSRNRTPRPAESAVASTDSKREEPAKAAAPAAAAEPSKQADPSQKPSGWLRGWFGKKEGEGSGPVRAKLGEESSMVYDNDLKRWVVKGAKPEAAAASTPPPPPRAQTASPSKATRDAPNARASSATPPPSQLSRSAGPGGAPPAPPSGLSRSSVSPASLGFTETADGGIRRQKSSLAESTTASDISAASPPPGGAGPPRPPSGPPRPPGASIDDLLSRPPSKRPASAARKGAKNRYVDVFQGQGNP